ncbi:hypothetical protein H4R33_004329 [Dimargaris cristalligena]|nr:hypothetical protein H4R33_004329 [Dimargaris cristalligena]
MLFHSDLFRFTAPTSLIWLVVLFLFVLLISTGPAPSEAAALGPPPGREYHRRRVNKNRVPRAFLVSSITDSDWGIPTTGAADTDESDDDGGMDI